MAIECYSTCPVLRIFDEAKAREFYLDFLGFTADWEHRFEEGMPLYMQVSLGGILLHLSEHHGDGCPGANVFFKVTGLEEYHREVASKAYKFARPGLEDTFYGARCMKVGDPFGNRLSFNEYHTEG